MIHNDDDIIQTLLTDSTNSNPSTTSTITISNHNENTSLTRVKRDRPVSRYLDEFDPEMSRFGSSPTRNSRSGGSIQNQMSISSPTRGASLMENDNLPLHGKSQSLSFPRVPLKNLSNLVIPSSVKSKTRQFTNSISRSMSEVVSKSSHSFFNTPKIEFNSIAENDDIPTNYDSDDDIYQVNGEDDNDDDDIDDDDEDGEDTFDTINIGSPIRRNTSNTNSQNNNQIISQNKDEPSKIRRFHSMYQTNKEKASYQIHEDNSILKFTNIEFSHLDSDLLPRITVDQLFKIQCGEHNDEFDEFIIVDCRFDYEYEGGHIINAINISSKETLESTFINNQQQQKQQQGDDDDDDSGAQERSKTRKLIIFHCEFSVFRGPMMAKHLRRCDRMLNYDNYPRLTYPDIVILEGGYKRFYENYSQWCNPQGYIEMKQHEKLCESNMDKIRRENKLTRHKSYQFGSNNMCLNRNSCSKDQLFWGSTASNHCRSQSYTTITNEKIIKRQRSIPKVKDSSSPTPPPAPAPAPMTAATSIGNPLHRLTRANTISLDQPMFTNKLISSPMTSPTSSTFDLNNNSSSTSLFSTQDFQPPSASFRSSSYRHHRKSISSNFSSTSINSIASATSSNGCSDSGSMESTLTEPYTSSSSPVLESVDYFDAIRKQQFQISRPQFSRKQGTRNIQQTQQSQSQSQLQLQSQQQQQLQFQFPKSRSSGKLFSTSSNYFTSPSANNNLINTNNSNSNSNSNINSNIFGSHNHSHSHNHSIGGGSSSSAMNSPFLTPATTSCEDPSSIIDPINDTPVDFLVPISTTNTTTNTSTNPNTSSIGNRYQKYKLHKRSGSLLSSTISENKELYSFVVDEEE